MEERIRKTDILNIVTSMKKACETLLKNNVSEADSISILTECQNAAIEIGNYIESTYEEQNDIIEILEMFCECIYQISLVYEEKELYKRQLKIAGKHLNDLYNKVNLKLPKDKKEIAFLPYKASMWDSLESVWRAAFEDEECDAYVVPIPYYDKKADGSFGEMHYEGDEYPEYVPITSWKDYSVSERRPDVIYIHNPYDDNNYVTSVHPDFYSNKLREYTNMLVYIPYFVAVNDKVKKELCMSPAVLFAHKVIVQSESVRKTYIEEFHKFEKENNCKDVFGIAEEKIVALGSPKYDKVINSKIEDFVIPTEWEKVLFREDGTRKKVILYNTTIEAMLEHVAMIDKIAEVLESFRDEKEVVLLWRPHPLLKSTLRAMRPQLVQRYEELETKYKEENYGIYDDSSDLYRAITLADAYYGDMSSVVELFKNTNKPILIQRVADEKETS